MNAFQIFLMIAGTYVFGTLMTTAYFGFRDEKIIQRNQLIIFIWPIALIIGGVQGIYMLSYRLGQETREKVNTIKMNRYAETVETV